jgi:hypothetical protein
MSEAREVLVTEKSSIFFGRIVAIHWTPVIEMLSRWKLDRVSPLAAAPSAELWSNIAIQNT